MLRHLRPAFVFTVLLSLITGLIYPLAITGIAQVAFSAPANGSLVTRGSTVVGSALIGQSFVSDRYFHGRPSATSATDPNDATKTVDAPYNASNSAASNLGPTNQKLVDRIRGAVGAMGGGKALVPADAITTSASGLDPDISPAFALAQVPGIAARRNLPVDDVAALVRRSVQGPALGLLGEAHVNVLALNLALDAMKT